VNLLSGALISTSLRIDNRGKVSMYDNSMIVTDVYVDNTNSGGIEIFGGYIGGGLSAHSNSKVTMSGGVIDDDLTVQDNSRVEISGGKITGLLSLNYFSTLLVSGGTFGGELRATGSSTIIIDGTNFQIGGGHVAYGRYTASDYPGVFGVNTAGVDRLTGLLANGDLLDNRFGIRDDAVIELVPEPATLLMLGLGGVLLRHRKS
jgi:hypothetical protein